MRSKMWIIAAVLRGLASWQIKSRFSLHHMGEQAGQLNCCARSLTRYANPLVSPAWIGVQATDSFVKECDE
jgi:hypothetical protein